MNTPQKKQSTSKPPLTAALKLFLSYPQKKSSSLLSTSSDGEFLICESSVSQSNNALTLSSQRVTHSSHLRFRQIQSSSSSRTRSTSISTSAFLRHHAQPQSSASENFSLSLFSLSLSLSLSLFLSLPLSEITLPL